MLNIEFKKKRNNTSMFSIVSKNKNGEVLKRDLTKKRTKAKSETNPPVVPALQIAARILT